MFSQRSSTMVCPECGARNPASARFCSACAARLGAEPSIGEEAVPVSSAMPAAPATADTGTIWVKVFIGGLVILLAFMGWALYMLTGSKVPQPPPTGQGAAVPEVPVAPSPPPSPPPVATAPSVAPSPPPVAPPPATTGTAAAPSDVFPYTPPPSAQQRRAARARARAAPAEAGAGDAATGAWVEPSRPPAMTSLPSYRDDGPPIVPGPRPAAGAAVPAGSSGTPVQPADPGPPVVAGPGPHYDFSTPGARGR
ncbi:MULTISPECIES: zinc ribbon domain-containing protein [unclassified Variovorax]|uniref:zinc ribbon domain-containing protein n=1 Tax=unclassified Variovorax TaxID=663243 RepID=UPI002578F814|nr:MULTISPECIES: zinc ribbon domain-containing protein [unclassified Variovorax]MDM0090710.1 zinc ribbon domain-containing protein [Variovorax sp. J22G40]MDM0149288.1 zinc ribbon domain-containing protein [Variovorax sp. J2P1-31]